MERKSSSVLFALLNLKLVRLLTILFTFSLLLSCNNGGDGEKTGKDSTAKSNDPVQMAIPQFFKYRIDASQLDRVSYQKLVLNVTLDNIQDPSSMGLLFYQAQTGGGVQISLPGQAAITADAAAVFNTQAIIVSNNEIIFDQYDWGQTDHLILEPTRINSNLAFNVTAVNSLGTPVPPSVPAGRSSKPSPPAPPAFIPN
ncbi:MAG: hypothetical protein ACT4OJ_00875 [Bacteroidota bacterium]